MTDESSRHNDRSVIPITANLVPDTEHLECLQRHFDVKGMLVRWEIFQRMRAIAPSYDGSFWSFHELSNGGLYLAPILSVPLRVCVLSKHFEEDLSVDAAGVVASALAYTGLALAYADDERIARHCRWLMEFARTHAESQRFLPALD